MRSDSKDTSKDTVPLPSSMLVRRRMPAGVDTSFAMGITIRAMMITITLRDNNIIMVMVMVIVKLSSS